MCGCTTGCETLNTGTLPTGLTGATGATGSQGLYGGFSYDWLFNTSTSTGPSSGDLRFNNSTYTSVTAIYVSDTGTGAVNCDLFLDSLSNNSKYGYVRIFDKDDSTKFWTGQITAVTDNGTDHTIAVTYILHNGTFSEDDAIVLTFSPAAQSVPAILSSNTTDVSTSGAGTDALMSYTVPANTLKTNEDVLELEMSYTTSGTTQNKNLSFTINGANFITKLTASPVSNTIELAKTTKYAKGKICIIRKSTTAIFVTIEFSINDNNYFTLYSYSLNEGTGAGIAVADLSTNTLTFACFGSNYDAVSNTETITQNELIVKYFNK